jgi:choline-sulfatase
MPDRPNVLFIMTDQQRADTIAALGNADIYTPNIDRLVERGVSFTNAYSQCPVCVPARYNVRTGRVAGTDGLVHTDGDYGEPGSEDDCGPYLPRVMRRHGYRTFGVGKFHTSPRYEDLGYDVHLYSEERYKSVENRRTDDYASYVDEEYPEYSFVEQPHGERSEMYYMPQMSPLPAEVTVEAWAADRAVEQIRAGDDRPFFGFVSFIGPHPPFAPPIPFNRIYDPEEMRDPVRGEKAVDHIDEQIPFQNYVMWAEDVGDSRVRTLRARYYGEITYIDYCVGRILDAVEERADAENTVVCFFSDHGDHMGDHHAWQKKSFFEGSCNVPFLVSWPAELPAGERRDELVCLTDLFGVATTAAGAPAFRDGIDLVGSLTGDPTGDAPTERDRLYGYMGDPGTREFKLMVREGDWKYIYFANGGQEQLFHLGEDPDELDQRADSDPGVASRLRAAAADRLADTQYRDALDDDGLRSYPHAERDHWRAHQLAAWRGVEEFPDHPSEVLDGWEFDWQVT